MRFLTTADVARLLGVSKQWVHRLDCVLKPMRDPLTGWRVYHEDTVLNYFKERERKKRKESVASSEREHDKKT